MFRDIEVSMASSPLLGRPHRSRVECTVLYLLASSALLAGRLVREAFLELLGQQALHVLCSGFRVEGSGCRVEDL